MQQFTYMILHATNHSGKLFDATLINFDCAHDRIVKACSWNTKWMIGLNFAAFINSAHKEPEAVAHVLERVKKLNFIGEFLSTIVSYNGDKRCDTDLLAEI